MSKAGIPVPTEITQKVMTAAQHLSKGVTNVPGFDLPHVETLIWGQSIAGTVERQCGHFFKLTITEQDLKNGVIIQCTSAGNDKFKGEYQDEVLLNAQITRQKGLQTNCRPMLTSSGYTIPVGSIS